jgi:transcriptional regulator with XRE-family HTH domain
MKKASKHELGRRLKELRESLDVSQGELAEAAGMDQSLLSRYERGEVSPSWLQVERLLDALGQSPCALFPECSSDSDPEENFFSIRYFSGKPKDLSGKDTPTSVLRIHKETLFVKLLHLPPIDDRFIVARAEDDIMIPDWYPGDYLVIDRKKQAKTGRIVVGFLDEEPAARRLVRDGKKLILVASNRHYSPLRFVESKWVHVGTVVYAFRDMGKRFAGMDGE